MFQNTNDDLTNLTDELSDELADNGFSVVGGDDDDEEGGEKKEKEVEEGEDGEKREDDDVDVFGYDPDAEDFDMEGNEI